MSVGNHFGGKLAFDRQGYLFIGALAQKALIRLTLDGDKMVVAERLSGDRGERIREVRSGPDGYFYLLTDERNGKLLKVGAS